VNGTLRVAGVETVEDLRTVNGNIEVFEARTFMRTPPTAMCTWSGASSVKTGAPPKRRTVHSFSPCRQNAGRCEARCLNGNFFSELPMEDGE